MALTITTVKRPATPARESGIFSITFDNSYVTGGLALDGSDLGFKGLIEYLDAKQLGVASRICEYDHTNRKLKLFTALSTEAANASDQSSITLRVFAIGTKDA